MKGRNILLEVLLAASLLIVVVTATSEAKLEALDNIANNEEALQNNFADEEDAFDEENDDDDEDEDDAEDNDLEQSGLLSMLQLNGRDGKKKNKCNGKAKNRCNRKGGSCVDAPFQEHCEEIYGSGGRLIKRACKSKHCQCCAPPTCNGKIKKPCSKRGGVCVSKPFKSNCNDLGGKLHHNIRSCQSIHCQCCITKKP